MVTFYVTSPFYENPNMTDIHDLSHATKEEVMQLIDFNFMGIVKVSCHGEESFFKKRFIRMDKDGFCKEGIFFTEVDGKRIFYRIVENINMTLARNEPSRKLRGADDDLQNIKNGTLEGNWDATP